MATIALAEAARQLGRPESGGIYLRGRKERYRKALEPAEPSDLFDLADLSIF